MIDWLFLSDMYYAAPELWYVLGGIIVVLLAVIVIELLHILRLKQKNYFLNRDRERYAETLYASKDGYFAFIYPDQKVNDPRQYIVERCSRRLAVIMNLPNGVKSSFEDILKNFYKEDIKKIQKYILLLREDGVSFDDDFMIKTANKCFHLAGSRINGIDGNVYCDMVWFRDVSFEANKISSLEKAKNNAETLRSQLQDMVDNLPFPAWIRDNKFKIINCNKKYLEYCNLCSKDDVIKKGVEIIAANGENVALQLAKSAITSNRQKKSIANIIRNGERLAMEIIETPFHAENCLDKIYTVGSMVDISKLDDLKRNLKIHQNAQLEILGTLGTAFAVFDQDLKLAFHNHAFASLWKLDDVWFETEPSYATFLDTIREKRLLPEVPDYLMFKNEEQKKFSQIIEPQKDMLHLPNGRTLSRMRAAYPAGGLIFAFEDITDRLATTSAYNALLTKQHEMLENLFDAVLIFGTNGRLSFYNQSYIKLWNADRNFLQEEPSIDELLDSQRSFFNKKEDWQTLKKNIAEHMLSITTKTFVLNRNNKDDVQISSCNLSDGSRMITYKKL
ncbi:MAG: PAS domain-containing protein [Alphaproteobacteria bacterium]|nr:PAS domain-containing protein [Alphaproteobacteria bacterium]